jgi:hypothetical protein
LKGEYNSGAVALEKPGELGGSQKEFEKGGVFLDPSCSGGGVGDGKHVWQFIGLSCVQSIDVGP